MPARSKGNLRKKSARAASPPTRAARVTPRSNGSKHMAEKKSGPGETGADRNVEQIRDILFGGQMRDYDRRFQELSQHIEGELARMRTDADKRLVALDKRLDEQLDKLGKALRQETGDRNKAVDDLESRLQQAARTQRAELNNAIDSVSRDLVGTDERLRAALAELDAAIKDHASRAGQALGSAREELRGEKVGREDLAALLTEVALRLQGQFDLPTK